jgi:hypothetical protein
MTSSMAFDLVVLDEAQRIKNANSTTALSCRMLRRKMAWALTGVAEAQGRSDGRKGPSRESQRPLSQEACRPAKG